VYGEQEAETERPRDGEGEACCDVSCNVNHLLLCSIHKRNVSKESEEMEKRGREREREEVGRARVGRQRAREKGECRGAEVRYLFHVSVDSYLKPHTSTILWGRRREEGGR